jgi:hypothetical protein
MNRKGLLVVVIVAVLAAGNAFALPEFKLSTGWGGYCTGADYMSAATKTPQRSLYA